MGRQVQRQANLTSGSRNDQETCVAIAESAKRKWDPRGSKGQTSWSPQTKVKSLIIMQSLLATVSRDYRMSCTLRSQDGIRYVGDFLRKHLWKEKERGVRTSRALRMQGRSDPGQGQKEGRKVRWKSLKLQCTSRNIWQSWWGSHESKSPIVEVLRLPGVGIPLCFMPWETWPQGEHWWISEYISWGHQSLTGKSEMAITETFAMV